MESRLFARFNQSSLGEYPDCMFVISQSLHGSIECCAAIASSATIN